ncbi:MAG: restriction endonuclease [Litorilinea sp.]
MKTGDPTAALPIGSGSGIKILKTKYPNGIETLLAMNTMPVFHQLLNPTLHALHALGGSGTIDEIYRKVSEILHLSDEVLEVPHNPNRGSQTKVEYRLAWARTYLKSYGLLENSERGVWALTAQGQGVHDVDPVQVVRFVRDELKQRTTEKSSTTVNDGLEVIAEEEEITEEIVWQDLLLQAVRNMDPSAFERLTQRLLREAGFIQVEVTGQTGDGGIDGKGIMRLGGFLSFHVIFQCKRYTGPVTAGQVRDFRGAMVGRADKGLLITTGHFTRDAMKEATRDGAPAIDLIDGDLLTAKLKEFGLGVRTRKVEHEEVEIDPTWFTKI